ncbi:MAG: isoprenylcysteine carboxylmethyltransferase family protein [Pseudomonadota bacterium]
MKWLNLPPVWLAGFMALAWGLAQIWAPLAGGPWERAALWAGRALIGGGLIWVIWAVIQFQRAKTTVIPHQQPSALVDGGPFRYSRNPIYLADLLILAGWSLTLGAPHTALLVVPFFVVLERLFIQPEEARLEAALGPAYTAYRTRVRRWL